MSAPADVIEATARNLNLVEGEVVLSHDGAAQIELALGQLDGDALVDLAKALVRFAGELHKQGWDTAANSILRAAATSAQRIQAFLGPAGTTARSPGGSNAFAKWSDSVKKNEETGAEGPVYSLLSLLAGK